jgi:hypothetical protein
MEGLFSNKITLEFTFMKLFPQELLKYFSYFCSNKQMLKLVKSRRSFKDTLKKIEIKFHQKAHKILKTIYNYKTNKKE